MYRAAAVKLSWKKAKGYKVDAYEVYRANAKNGKYVKLYTTKNAKKRSFTNGRNLQAGKTYYYKVRGVRTVDGKKYYTKWSNISAKKTRETAAKSGFPSQGEPLWAVFWAQKQAENKRKIP